MSVEEFLASACSRKNLNPMEHFVRVKKRRDMEDHNYFVPHRTDLIETYVSNILKYIMPLKYYYRCRTAYTCHMQYLIQSLQPFFLKLILT